MSEQIADLHIDFTAHGAVIKKQIDDIDAKLKGTQTTADRAAKATGSAFTGLSKGVRSAIDDTKKLQAQVTLLTRGALGLAAAFGGNQIIQFTANAVSSAAELGRLATQAGLNIRQFQELGFAMRSAGVGQEQLAQASATLARNLGELQSGGGALRQFLQQAAPQLIAQFQSVTNVNEAWELLADTLARIPDAHNRVRLAQVAIGEAGARMTDVLTRGRDGLRQAGEEARKLGAVLSDHAVKQATNLELRFRTLAKVIDTTFKTALVNVAEALGALDPTTEQVRSRAVRSFEEINEIQQRINSEVLLYDQRQSLVNTQQRLHKQMLDDIAATWDTVVTKADQYGNLLENSTTVIPKGTPKPQERFPGVASPEEERQNALEESRRRANMALGNIDRNLTQNETYLSQGADAWAEWAMQGSGAYDQLKKASADQLEFEEKAMEMRRGLADRYSQAIMDTAQMAGQALTTLFPKSKAAAIAEAVINTAVGVTKAFRDVPWPLNIAQAAMVAATGAAQIAAIRSANLGGGGNVGRVGGGASAPNTPTAAPIAQRGSINIVMKQGMIWSTEQVTELMQRISEEVNQGNTLISTRTAGM